MAGKASREGGSGASSSPCPPLSLEWGAGYCGGRPTPECYSPQQQCSPNLGAERARPVATLALLPALTNSGALLRRGIPHGDVRVSPGLGQVLFGGGLPQHDRGSGFQLWFYFHLFMWVIHWGLLLRLPWRTWVAPVRARCGGGAAAWVAAFLAAPGTQGSWRLGQQKIQCSRRVWQPVLANTL